MAVLSSGGRHALPDSAFAYIEPGHDGEKLGGKTPDKYRHFPVHDAAHARNALARAGQGARFGKEAMGKIKAAAKKFGVDSEGSETGRSLESLYPEVRFLADVPEIRSMDDGPPHITGYAAAFGKLSRRLGGFVERVMPSAFNDARDGGWEHVVCRYNHKDDMVLGTTGAGTLALAVDERGLSYDVIPPNCRGDVMEYVQRGDVRYSSFAFRCLNPGEDDEWGITDYNFPMRSLHKVSLLDVAPVLDPAYRDTTATARNMMGAVESLAMWVGTEPSEVRSMLEAGQAMRFFKRTDRPAAKAQPALPESDELRMVDDETVALRTWTYADEAEAEPETVDEDTTGEASEDDDDERAMNTHDQMCKQYTDGEPCVKGTGHGDDHAPRCKGGEYGTATGLPCAKVSGHNGPHVPIAIDDEAKKSGPGRPKMRDGEEAGQGEEKRTLSGPAALAAVMAMRQKMASID